MIVSPNNAFAIVLLIPALLLLALETVIAQENRPDGELPRITVGRVPSSMAPKLNTKNLTKPRTRIQAGTKGGPLKLHLNPNTGQPLSAQQLEEQVKRRSGQSPRPLRAQRHTGSPLQAQKIDKLSEAKSSAGDIQMKTLGRAKVSVIGLLSETEGGFSEDMWSGTPLALVLQLLPRLPIEVSSPAMQSLRRRLLISTAMPPEDSPGSGSASAIDPDGSALLAARIERLAESGDSVSVNQLLKFKPLTMENPVYAQVRLRSELLNGNVREVCRMARNQVGNSRSSVTSLMWQKIMAFCLAIAGQGAQVELYQQVLYENGVEDEAYFNLLSGLSSGEFEPLGKLERTSPLHLAMLRTARQVIPDNALETASPSVLSAIATSPNASLALRLEAAERAEDMGILSTEILRRVYASVPLTPEQAANAIALADKKPGPMARAILYQVAQIDSQIEGRSRALAAAWRNGLRSGRYFTTVRVNLSQAQAIGPSVELAWFAGAIGRALLIAGDHVRAREWLMTMAPLAGKGHPEAAAAVLELAPLLQIGAKERGDNELASIIGKVLKGWWAGMVANNGMDRHQHATRLFTVFSSLGHDVPAELWTPLYVMSGEYHDVKQSQPALLVGLERAAEANRLGEVVLLSLLLLGDEGPGLSDPVTLGRIVSALRKVSLEKDAANIAIEGLLVALFD